MPTVIRTCEVCGNTFKWLDCKSARSKNGGHFCSRKCKGIASRLPLGNCEWCGAEFQPTYHQHRFCSPLCSETSKRENRKTGRNNICEQCGNEFYVVACRENEARFCSRECQNKWQGRNKLEFRCKICGKKYRLSKSRAEQTNPTYCSIECRNNDPALKERLLAMNVLQQSLSPNKLELAGYAILDEIGIAYDKQVPLFNKFVVDAYIPDCSIVIQFDGDYWHGNPDRFPILDDRQSKRAALDKSQDSYMRKCGLSILRFWGNAIRKSPESVRYEIESAIKVAHASATPQ